MEEITEEALDHFYHLHAQKKEMERELNTMKKYIIDWLVLSRHPHSGFCHV